jgi:hypothetical protein
METGKTFKTASLTEGQRPNQSSFRHPAGDPNNKHLETAKYHYLLHDMAFQGIKAKTSANIGPYYTTGCARSQFEFIKTNHF